jgi:hypothetical protein
VSYGRLDVWDIAYVDWWTTEKKERAEQHLLTHYRPYLNFTAEYDSAVTQTGIDIGSPGGTLQLITEDELEYRSLRYNRSKQKLEHILRMIDKIKLADHSADTRRTLYEHKRIFDENVAEFLGVENTEQVELTD